jgi:hypothetical protein
MHGCRRHGLLFLRGDRRQIIPERWVKTLCRCHSDADRRTARSTHIASLHDRQCRAIGLKRYNAPMVEDNTPMDELRDGKRMLEIPTASGWKVTVRTEAGSLLWRYPRCYRRMGRTAAANCRISFIKLHQDDPIPFTGGQTSR